MLIGVNNSRKCQLFQDLNYFALGTADFNTSGEVALNTNMFLTVLEYMYTDEIQIDQDNITEISKLADYLEMPGNF